MENALNLLTILLEDNQLMKNNQAIYLNALLTTRAKHPQKKEEKKEEYENRWKATVSQNENEEIIKLANNLRGLVILVHKNYRSIKQHLNLPKEKEQEITKAYEHIETTLIPNYTIVDSYTQNINDILEKYINVKALLNLKQKITQLANQNQPTQPGRTNA